MENDRNPNRHTGSWYVAVRKMPRRPAGIAQLEDAVPDEKARHQQARKRRQVGFHGVHGSSLPTSRPERASYGSNQRRVKVLSNVYLDQQQAAPKPAVPGDIG